MGICYLLPPLYFFSPQLVKGWYSFIVFKAQVMPNKADPAENTVTVEGRDGAGASE